MENYTNQIVSLDYLEPGDVANLVRENHKEHVILDVRDSTEFDQGHVKGANSLPRDKWNDHDFVQEVINNHIDKDTIVVHCFHSKQRGPTCARILADNLEKYVLENPREKIPKVRVMRGGFHDFSANYSDSADLIEKEETNVEPEEK